MTSARDIHTHQTGAPLKGRSVVVTRARSQAGALADELERLGADVVAVPVIEIVEPDDLGPVRRAIDDLHTYEWVVLTSANGVERFMSELGDPARLSGIRIAVVGSATARCLARYGLSADVVPDDFRAEGLVDALVAAGVGDGTRVLFPRAAKGRDIIPAQLGSLGAVVDLVTVYRTVPATADPATIERLRDGVDAVTFTSPSTVRNFLAFLDAAGIDASDFMSTVAAASIGPVTSEALRQRGCRVACEAAEYTVQGLATALAEYFVG